MSALRNKKPPVSERPFKINSSTISIGGGSCDFAGLKWVSSAYAAIRSPAPVPGSRRPAALIQRQLPDAHRVRLGFHWGGPAIECDSHNAERARQHNERSESSKGFYLQHKSFLSLWGFVFKGERS
jgi:hypothetical protein